MKQVEINLQEIQDTIDWCDREIMKYEECKKYYKKLLEKATKNKPLIIKASDLWD